MTGKYHNGFTLLELMIAILLFSMISTASFKLFSSVNAAQQSTQQTLKDLTALKRARILLQQDLLQLAARPVRDEFGDHLPAIQGGRDNDYLLEFTRAGWQNPLLDKRSRLQRIAYGLERNQLVRYYWPVLDRAQDSSPVRQVLITDVTDITLRFMGPEKRWQNSWPVSEPETKSGEQTLRWQLLPLAVELVLISEAYGSVSLILPAPGMPEKAS
ncbi:type II secretion system minor pseudopilin GspJ [Endozoicomonas ascidiicola]|uniref:type II secretion system minor pseudopilin GspJ n=1 Tax=Endozoicomonas ascidiicola TaxID=1698521 RepID=UPI000831FE93|nr:type II secretion system minor pseudopilin GspJ [Endozoicomonas ascidiicola]